jgi:hypothetical protein
MPECEPSFELLLDQIGFADSSSPIDGNEFGFFAVKAFLEERTLVFPSNHGSLFFYKDI